MATVLDVPSPVEKTSPRPFYSVSEAAALLGVSRVTVWRWIKSGRLSPTRLGHRTVRIPHEDMARLLRRTSHEAAPLPNVERGHFVLFYEADAFLEKSVAAFLRDGLAQRTAALVVATQAHREGIAEQLGIAGVDLAGLRREGRYVELDAAKSL